MFGRFSVILFILPVFLSCAKPNYQKSPLKFLKNGMCLQQLPSGLCVDVLWQGQAQVGKYSSFILNFYNKNSPNDLVTLAEKLEVELYMPEMSHGTQPVKIVPLANGSYRVNRVFLSMHGLWEIQIFFKKGDKISEQLNIPFKI